MRKLAWHVVLGLLACLATFVALLIAIPLAVSVVWPTYIEEITPTWVLIVTWLPASLVGGYVSASRAKQKRQLHGIIVGCLGYIAVYFLLQTQIHVFHYWIILTEIAWFVTSGFVGAIGAQIAIMRDSAA